MAFLHEVAKGGITQAFHLRPEEGPKWEEDKKKPGMAAPTIQEVLKKSTASSSSAALPLPVAPGQRASASGSSGDVSTGVAPPSALIKPEF